MKIVLSWIFSGPSIGFASPLIFASSLLVGFPASALEQKPLAYVLCKNGGSVRPIHITPGGHPDIECKVSYSKVGVEQVVGQSRSLAGCKSILKNIQNNLEASNWKCRAPTSASISYGSDVTVQ